MTKKYKSNSEIHINIYLSSGNMRRIAFTPMTGGGSTFATDDTAVQRGLERHAGYGTMFVCYQTIGEQVPAKAKPANPKQEESKPVTSKARVKTLDDAKDYLSDKFGVSRTKLRSRAAIIAAGKEHGVEFEWQ